MQVNLELEKQVQACKEPQKLIDIAMQSSGAERALAQHELAPEKLLKRLAVHGDKYVRFYVAKNNNTDEQSLRKLASDSEVVVREAARLSLILRRQGSLQST